MAFLTEAFRDRIVPFASACAEYYAEIRANREAVGRPITVTDALIAATVRARGAILATRNSADFQGIGIDVVDPWTLSGSGK
jgi:toxin FitB